MGFRVNRLAEEIKREVTDIIRNNLKDPRVNSLTSLTAVEVSGDRRFARIYVSIYGSDEEQAQTLEGLQRATGFIRAELGRRIRLRYLPELSFNLDPSIQQGIKINQIIRQVRAAEEKEQL